MLGQGGGEKRAQHGMFRPTARSCKRTVGVERCSVFHHEAVRRSKQTETAQEEVAGVVCSVSALTNLDK